VKAPVRGNSKRNFEPINDPTGRYAAKGSAVTAAEFEHLTVAEAEDVLRVRLRLFLSAGADLTGALRLAARVEIPQETASQLLRLGFPAETTLRLLY
jgi:hypothetical protein